MLDANVRKMMELRGIPRLNSELFTEETHRDNNSIISHFEDFLWGYGGWYGGKSLIGYTDHPAFCECNGYGIMFEGYDGNDFWCHYREETMEIVAEIVLGKMGEDIVE